MDRPRRLPQALVFFALALAFCDECIPYDDTAAFAANADFTGICDPSIVVHVAQQPSQQQFLQQQLQQQHESNHLEFRSFKNTQYRVFDSYD
jgi:hypothetical protein